MAESYGDITLNGKAYRIDLQSYRMRDVIDFSPRASTPGGSIIHSDLMLYQPLMQTGWQHGFGFPWYEDADGYMKTEGNIDTRHEGIAMLYTNKTSSDTADYDKIGGVIHKKKLYTWGAKGIRMFDNSAWNSLDYVTPQQTGTVKKAQAVGATTLSITDVTVPENGDDPILLVAIATKTNIAITDIKYDGFKLKRATYGGTSPKVSIYYLSNPTTGSAKTLTATLGSAGDVAMAAIPLAYVHSVTPISTPPTPTTGTGTSSLIAVTSDFNRLVLDAVAVLDGPDIAADASQNALAEQAVTGSVILGASTEAGSDISGGVEMSWTWTGSKAWAAVAVSLNAATSMGGVNAIFSNDEYLFVSPRNGRIRKSTNAQTLISSPNETEGEDTYLDEKNPTDKHGKTKTLFVGTEGTPKHRSALIRFPEIADIPPGATITSAKLKLYVVEKENAPAISIHRILVDDWKEGSADWNTMDGTTAWHTAGCKAAGTDPATADHAVATLYSGTPNVAKHRHMIFNLDLTEFDLLKTTNYGIVIHDNATIDDSYWEFASSSAPEDEADHRPTLEVSYKYAGEWTDTGVNDNAKDFSWFIVHGGKIYAGERKSNRVHYSTTSDLSDLEGGSADADKIEVGLGNVPTTGAISFAGFLYLARPDGLWQLGDDNNARRVQDFSNCYSDNNLKSMAVHNGYLVFPIQNTLYQWNGSRLSDITPRRLDDHFPYTTYGDFKNLTTIGGYLYCTAKTNETDYYEALLCFDGVAWHKLCDLITPTFNPNGTVTMLLYDPVNSYLWVHVNGSSSNTTYYIPLQETSDFPYADFPTTGTHALYSSRLDMGFRRVTKSSPSMLIEASNLTSNRYLTVYYNLDGTTTSPTSTTLQWTKWGKITHNGFTELVNPNSEHTQEYKYMQIKIEFTTNSATQSPILEGWTLRFIMRPEVAFGWNMNLPIADNLVYGEFEYGRSAKDLWADLRIARDSKAPIIFSDIDGTEYYVYLTAMTSQAVERNVDTENGEVASIERIANINLVEAR